ncbi:MAG: prepilin-type N-terminal cleavage/methylation domain-containing protein [Candidatus Omnitrophica bacterium]|nr:prepilin-type N-terminal cleavage/methylation domain-containing protein [Candidatus Omnitrophota bacterium]
MIKRNNSCRDLSRNINDAHGFTLIEILLGLSIFSLIIVCVYGTLKTGIDLNARFENHKDIFRQTKIVMDLFSQDIEGAVVYDFSNSYPDRFSFTGAMDQLTFIMPSTNGLKTVSYYLSMPDKVEIKQTIIGEHYQKNTTVTETRQTGPPALCLIREEMDFIDYMSAGFKMNGEKEILLQNIPENGIQFFYADKINADGAIVWKKTWTDIKLPLAVKMDLKIVSDLDKEPRTFHFEKISLIPTTIQIKQVQ